MKTIPLSEAEARALLALVKYVRMTCAALGDLLWHKGGRGNCSCPFARPAGAVLKKLRHRGFAERVRVANDHRNFYRATRTGERHLRTDKATRIAAGLTNAAPGAVTPAEGTP